MKSTTNDNSARKGREAPVRMEKPPAPLPPPPVETPKESISGTKKK